MIRRNHQKFESSSCECLAFLAHLWMYRMVLRLIYSGKNLRDPCTRNMLKMSRVCGLCSIFRALLSTFNPNSGLTLVVCGAAGLLITKTPEVLLRWRSGVHVVQMRCSHRGLTVWSQGRRRVNI